VKIEFFAVATAIVSQQWEEIRGLIRCKDFGGKEFQQ
jgi:hypothetical protein